MFWLRLIANLIRPYRARLIFAMVLTVLVTASTLTPPLAMRYLLDKVITPRHWSLLTPIVIVIAVLPLWNTVLDMLNRLLITAIGQRLIVDLRTALYRHVLSLSLRFHSVTGTGKIMSRMMTDVMLVQGLVTSDTIGMIASFIRLIFCVGFVAYFNWKLAAILVVMLIMYALNYQKFNLRIRNSNLELRELMDEVTGRLQERLAGVRLVKTYCREQDETDEFVISTDRALQFGMRRDMLSVSLWSSARVIGGIGSTLVYCLAAWFVLKGQMTYGIMQMVDNYLWQAVWPAINLTMAAGQINQALVSLERIAAITNQVPEVREKPNAYDLHECQGDIQFSHVSFAYKEDQPIFTDFNLSLPAGKMTALVGHTGCGKTTVTNLLLRLWDVQEGSITLDGHDIRDLTIRSLRWHMGVVPQEPVAFEGTVYDNIAYGMPETNQEDVEEAARAAQIHESIMALPNQYATWLGKEGAKLSVGEKQRIAIARAILRKPAVLILDEATSSLDSESELAIQQAMRIVLRGRTSVVVAHRLSTIVEADQIITMDQGRVVEMGTHDELMMIENGHYRKLYEELTGQHGHEVVL